AAAALCGPLGIDFLARLAAPGLAGLTRITATRFGLRDQLEGAQPTAGRARWLDEHSVHRLLGAAQRRTVTDARDQSLGSRDRDVEAVRDSEEADPPALIRADQGDDHDVLLASLERVDGV